MKRLFLITILLLLGNLIAYSDSLPEVTGSQRLILYGKIGNLDQVMEVVSYYRDLVNPLFIENNELTLLAKMYLKEATKGQEKLGENILSTIFKTDLKPFRANLPESVEIIAIGSGGKSAPAPFFLLTPKKDANSLISYIQTTLQKIAPNHKIEKDEKGNLSLDGKVNLTIHDGKVLVTFSMASDLKSTYEQFLAVTRETPKLINLKNFNQANKLYGNNTIFAYVNFPGFYQAVFETMSLNKDSIKKIDDIFEEIPVPALQIMAKALQFATVTGNFEKEKFLTEFKVNFDESKMNDPQLDMFYEFLKGRNLKDNKLTENSNVAFQFSFNGEKVFSLLKAQVGPILGMQPFGNNVLEIIDTLNGRLGVFAKLRKVQGVNDFSLPGDVMIALGINDKAGKFASNLQAIIDHFKQDPSAAMFLATLNKEKVNGKELFALGIPVSAGDSLYFGPIGDYFVISTSSAMVSDILTPVVNDEKLDINVGIRFSKENITGLVNKFMPMVLQKISSSAEQNGLAEEQMIISSLTAAIEMYHMDNDKYPVNDKMELNIEALVEENYIQENVLAVIDEIQGPIKAVFNEESGYVEDIILPSTPEKKVDEVDPAKIESEIKRVMKVLPDHEFSEDIILKIGKDEIIYREKVLFNIKK